MENISNRYNDFKEKEDLSPNEVSFSNNNYPIIK